MKLNSKLMLVFKENQSFLDVILRNYEFMYTPRAESIKWISEGDGRVSWGLSLLSGLIIICEIVNSVGRGSFTFVRKKS